MLKSDVKGDALNCAAQDDGTALENVEVGDVKDDALELHLSGGPR